MPFIMGMEESVYNSRKNLFEDESQIIFILNIRKNNLYMVEKKKPTKNGTQQSKIMWLFIQVQLS